MMLKFQPHQMGGLERSCCGAIASTCAHVCCDDHDDAGSLPVLVRKTCCFVSVVVV